MTMKTFYLGTTRIRLRTRVFFDDLTVEVIKNEVDEFSFLDVRTGDENYRAMQVALVPAGFDIECYKQYMYIWTFTIRDMTIIGYTWEEFNTLLDMIKEALDLNREVKTIKHRTGEVEEKELSAKVLPVFIHNIRYEWSFMRSQIKVSSKPMFMDDTETNPLFVVANDSFLFIDSYKVYPMRLKEVAKAYTITQKTSDLDYHKPRTVEDAKHLNEKELNYCCNDTIILSELAQYTFDHYVIPYGKLPMTQNQIVKAAIKKTYHNELSTMTEKEKNDLIKQLKRMSLDQQQYKFIRRDGARGGFCHSSVNHHFGPVGYGDLTSAYCMAIIHGYYPMGKYDKPLVEVTKANLEYFTERYCCQMRIKFFGLEARSSKGQKFINLESYDGKKVIPYLPDGTSPVTDEEKRKVRRSVLTNASGRISSAACIMVSINEIDWELYKKCYKWDDFEIYEVQTAVRGPLPEYVKKTAFELYEKKARLKKAGIKGSEYFSAKTLVSNIFGAMFQKKKDELVDGPENEWWKNTLDEHLKAQWGCYVSAHVRKVLIDMILKLGIDNWLYSDTDSIYYVLNEDTRKVFKLYNAKMKFKNMAVCEKYGLDYKVFDDLGCFDDDSSKGLTITHFKTIGAKAYLYFYKDNEHKHGAWKLVLAGIPEEFFWKAYAEAHPVCKIADKEHEILNVFKFFSNATKITYVKHTLVPVEDTTDIINGVEVHCDTGCYIKEETFTGTIGNVQEIVETVAVVNELLDKRS